MEARLQRRVQRYGWDRAAPDYERGWRAQLAPAHAHVLAGAELAPGASVLDVACGTGLVSLPAARSVGPAGNVLGVDLSGEMVARAQALAQTYGCSNATFARMDAEQLALEDASFDVALCALGLMFLPDWQRAVDEMRRVVRPGGRVVLAVWGERARCAWSSVFPIIEAEVATDVCPLFFHLGRGDALGQTCAAAGLVNIRVERLPAVLAYGDSAAACDAALVGGPSALAWSRLDAAARARVQSHYLASIEPWRDGAGYRLPAEFVIAAAHVAAC